MSGRSCANCDHWLSGDKERGEVGELSFGECRRFPPSVPLIAERGQFYERTEEGSTRDSVLMGWPETFAPNRCGEWAPDFDTGLETM